MLVSIPLHLEQLPGNVKAGQLEEALSAHYRGGQYVRVVTAAEMADAGGKLEPQSLNDTNRMELRVYANEARGHAVLVAKLDNLGKGASGAAVQNLELMLSLEPVSAA